MFIIGICTHLPQLVPTFILVKTVGLLIISGNKEVSNLFSTLIAIYSTDIFEDLVMILSHYNSTGLKRLGVTKVLIVDALYLRK